MRRTNLDSLRSCLYFRVFRLNFAFDFFNLLLRAARYATVCFEQNRYSDFVLTAAFLCLLVTVFELTGRLKENFLFILLPPLFPIPNKKKSFLLAHRK